MGNDNELNGFSKYFLTVDHLGEDALGRHRNISVPLLVALFMETFQPRGTEENEKLPRKPWPTGSLAAAVIIARKPIASTTTKII